jgi:hypothetical protein
LQKRLKIISMNSLKRKYSSCFELINAFALVNSGYLLERERERERDATGVYSLITRVVYIKRNKFPNNNLLFYFLFGFIRHCIFLHLPGKLCAHTICCYTYDYLIRPFCHKNRIHDAFSMIINIVCISPIYNIKCLYI